MVLYTDIQEKLRDWTIGSPKETETRGLQVSYLNHPTGEQFVLDLHGQDKHNPITCIFLGEGGSDEQNRHVLITPGESDPRVHEQRLEAISNIEDMVMKHAYANRVEIFGTNAGRWGEDQLRDMYTSPILPKRDEDRESSIKVKLAFNEHTKYRTKTQSTADVNTLRGKMPKMVGYIKLSLCVWFTKDRFGSAFKIKYLLEKSRIDMQATSYEFTRIKTRVGTPTGTVSTKEGAACAACVDPTEPMDTGGNSVEDDDGDTKRARAADADVDDASEIEAKRLRHDMVEEP